MLLLLGQLLPLFVERRARLNARLDLGALNAGQAWMLWVRTDEWDRSICPSRLCRLFFQMHSAGVAWWGYRQRAGALAVVNEIVAGT